jgi:7,8-dihydropterin-6-yl-methyl-4-(beta-D-ribofuranosyl)aminobenzene 5'-phosphate synthase
MKITFLTDNYVDMAYLKAEHGFSCFIEYENTKILFDTGATTTTVENSKVIFGKLPKADFAILSHGHYDHTGGLKYSLEDISKITNKIYCHKFIFDNHLKETKNGYKYIGMETDNNQFRKKIDLIQNENFTEIKKNIYLSGTVERYVEFNADEKLIAEIEGKFIKDPFRDEQFLIIDDNGLVIISGCSHSGIMNIIEHAKKLIPGKKVKAVIGGFHLFRSTEEQLKETIDYFKENKIEKIITGHCTGLKGLFAFHIHFQKNLIPVKVGLTVEI